MHISTTKCGNEAIADEIANVVRQFFQKPTQNDALILSLTFSYFFLHFFISIFTNFCFDSLISCSVSVFFFILSLSSRRTLVSYITNRTLTTITFSSRPTDVSHCCLCKSFICINAENFEKRNDFFHFRDKRKSLMRRCDDGSIIHCFQSRGRCYGFALLESCVDIRMDRIRISDEVVCAL